MAKRAALTAAAKQARVVPAKVSRENRAAVIGKASRQVHAKAAVEVGARHGAAADQRRSKSA